MSEARKWLVILVAMLPTILAWGASVAAIGLWAVPWMNTYAASHGQLMATSMCMLLGIGCFSPLAGYITEKISVRNLFVAGLVVMAVTYFLVSRATAMWQITLLHAFPLAAGLALTSAMMGQLLAVRLFQPKPGLAIGIATIGAPTGGIIAPLVVGKLLSVHTWQSVLVITAVACLALVPVILTAIPNLPNSPRPGEAGRIHHSTYLPIMTILTDRVFVGLVMTVTVLYLLYNAVYYNLGPYMQDIGGGATGTANILSITAIPAFIGTLTFPALSDRLDYRFILLVSVIVTASGVAFAATGPGVFGMTIILPAMALIAGGLYSLTAAIIAQRFGKENFARANGMSLPFTFLNSIGPLAAGLGRDKFGDYPHTFAVMLGLIVIPIIGLLLVSTAKGGEVEFSTKLQKNFPAALR